MNQNTDFIFYDDGDDEFVQVVIKHVAPLVNIDAWRIERIAALKAELAALDDKTISPNFAHRNYDEDLIEFAAAIAKAEREAHAELNDIRIAEIRALVMEIASEAADNGNAMDDGCWLPVTIEKIKTAVSSAIFQGALAQRRLSPD